jgi:hypothetical protein
LLGIVLNLYVAVLASDAHAGLMQEIASGPLTLTLHALLGLALIGTAILLLPRAGRGPVAAEDLGAVGAAGGGGAVGVQRDGPAPLVDHDVVVEETEQCAVFDRGGAAVGLVGQVMHLTGGGGLVAAARMLPQSAQDREQASWKTCSPPSMTVADAAWWQYAV